jgi:hypothetical protein
MNKKKFQQVLITNVNIFLNHLVSSKTKMQQIELHEDFLNFISLPFSSLLNINHQIDPCTLFALFNGVVIGHL